MELIILPHLILLNMGWPSSDNGSIRLSISSFLKIELEVVYAPQISDSKTYFFATKYFKRLLPDGHSLSIRDKLHTEFFVNILQIRKKIIITNRQKLCETETVSAVFVRELQPYTV